MVPERGKSSGGCVKRCKIFVFEMCSSIKVSFAVGKNTKGPALDELVLVIGFSPAQSQGQGEGDSVQCGFWCLGEVLGWVVLAVALI